MSEPPPQGHTARAWLPAVLRALAAGLLLWLAWHQAHEWPALWHRGTLHLHWVAAAFAAGGAALAGWALRWWLVVRAVGIPMRFSEALWLTLCADFFNFYFLGPLGADGFRILRVGQNRPGTHGLVTASILLDHVVGMLGTGIAFLLLTVPRWGELTSAGGVGAAAVKVAGIALIALTAFTLPGFLVASRTGRLFGCHRLPVPPMGRPVAEKLALLTDNPQLAVRTLAASVCSSLSHYAAFAAAARAIEAPVQSADVFALMPAVESLASIPFTISGLGLRENLLVDLMGRCFQTPGETALTVSLLGFAAVGAWGAIGGVALLLSRWRKNDVTGGEATTGV